jgi:tetrahydromethanopterin S-methyltransferase subunit F
METIKLNTISNATKKARAKKKRQTPKSTLLKRNIKTNFQEKVLSINGLLKFAKTKGKGLKQTNELIQHYNVGLKNPIKLDDITVKTVLENLTDKERFISKNGVVTSEKRTVFSTHHIGLAIGRIAKSRKQEQTIKKVVKKAA